MRPAPGYADYRTPVGGPVLRQLGHARGRRRLRHPRLAGGPGRDRGQEGGAAGRAGPPHHPAAHDASKTRSLNAAPRPARGPPAGLPGAGGDAGGAQRRAGRRVRAARLVRAADGRGGGQEPVPAPDLPGQPQVRRDRRAAVLPSLADLPGPVDLVLLAVPDAAPGTAAGAGRRARRPLRRHLRQRLRPGWPGTASCRLARSPGRRDGAVRRGVHGVHQRPRAARDRLHRARPAARGPGRAGHPLRLGVLGACCGPAARSGTRSRSPPARNWSPPRRPTSTTRSACRRPGSWPWCSRPSGTGRAARGARPRGRTRPAGRPAHRGPTPPRGRTMVAAHSGALAAADGGWEALARAYGVHRVGDLAEFADTLELFAIGRRRAAPARARARRAGIATVHDSGLERAHAADVADERRRCRSPRSASRPRPGWPRCSTRADPGQPAGRVGHRGRHPRAVRRVADHPGRGPGGGRGRPRRRPGPRAGR